MDYKRLNDSDSFSKRNKSYTYLEEHERDNEFQTTLKNIKAKQKDGQIYEPLKLFDPDVYLREKKISIFN